MHHSDPSGYVRGPNSDKEGRGGHGPRGGGVQRPRKPGTSSATNCLRFCTVQILKIRGILIFALGVLT